MGHFSRAIGNKRFAIEATDYFTKWVESEALVNICDIDENTKRHIFLP